MLKSKKQNSILTSFILALIISSALIIPAIIRGNGILYLTNDFSTQQNPFYTLCHEAIRSGSLYSYLTGLGSSLIGSYSFYTLGSPFFLITLPFPTSFLPYLLGPLLILKFSLSALTACLYIKEYVKNQSYAVLASLLYAFSGYQLFNIFYNHFEDVCVVAPLLLFALDRAMKDKNRGLFALAVFLNALVNYVFFVGSVVFCIIYFTIKIISGDYKLNKSRFVRLAIEAVLGFSLSAVLVLPAVLSLISHNRVDNTISGLDMLIFSQPVRYLEIIRAFLFPSGTPHIEPFFYKGAGVCWTSPALYIPLFSIAPAISLYYKKGKSFLKIIFPALLVFMFIPLLNSIFSALNAEYYARWFYFPSLLLSLSVAKVLEDSEEDPKPLSRSSVITFFITLFSAVAFLLIPVKLESGKLVPFISVNEDIPYTIFYILSALVGQALLFVLIKISFNHNLRRQLLLISSVIIILTVGTVNITTLSYAYPDREIYKESFIDGCDLFDYDADDAYRIDTTYIHYNAHMWWRKPSMATFNSTISSGEVSFYQNIKYNRYVATLLGEGYFSLRYLFSVKYAFYDQGEDCMMPGFNYVGDYNGFRVYENDYYIPMGFTFSKYMTKEDLAAADNLPLSRLFLKALLLNEEQIEKYSASLSKLDIEPVLKYNSNIGLTTTINDAKMLRKTAGYYFKWENNGFTSKIELNKGNLVFYSVPYDKGFKAYVNGTETPIEKVNGGFMAVYAPAGDNRIEFRFYPSGLKTGIIITIVSSVFLAGYLIISGRKKNK